MLTVKQHLVFPIEWAALQHWRQPKVRTKAHPKPLSESPKPSARSVTLAGTGWLRGSAYNNGGLHSNLLTNVLGVCSANTPCLWSAVEHRETFCGTAHHTEEGSPQKHRGGALQEFHCPLPPGNVAVHCRSSTAKLPPGGVAAHCRSSPAHCPQVVGPACGQWAVELLQCTAPHLRGNRVVSCTMSRHCTPILLRGERSPCLPLPEEGGLIANFRSRCPPTSCTFACGSVVGTAHSDCKPQEDECSNHWGGNTGILALKTIVAGKLSMEEFSSCTSPCVASGVQRDCCILVRPLQTPFGLVKAVNNISRKHCHKAFSLLFEPP